MTTQDNLDGMIDVYHVAADEFSRGDPKPVKALFSEREDVTLANPFGPAVRGSEEVSGALDYASSRFRDGNVSFERIAIYASPDLATILELERWNAKVGGSEDLAHVSRKSLIRSRPGRPHLCHHLSNDRQIERESSGQQQRFANQISKLTHIARPGVPFQFIEYFPSAFKIRGRFLAGNRLVNQIGRGRA